LSGTNGISSTPVCAGLQLPAKEDREVHTNSGVGEMSSAIDKIAATERRPVLVDLALQGGGSHGAFTWGVLDRLLEEPWIRIDAISGTSAGAMNAAVLVDGWSRGGADGARTALDAYWRRVSRAAAFSPLQRTPLDRLMGRWTLDTSPAYLAIDLMSRVFSPYDLNPAGFNPLRQVLAESIDFERLVTSPIKLFITATNVHTGRGRIFRNSQITPEVLLASACLPTMFQAIEIEGEPYWDGGFAGNPTITPLVRESDAQDTILIQINPRERQQTPKTAGDILDRLNEISFNSPLMKELRMIALLRQAADPGQGEGARWANMRTHRIMTDKLAEFGASSKLNAESEFLAMLKAEGRKSAGDFLTNYGADLGNKSSSDIDVLLAEC
jgi:NTE family protein